MEQDYKIKLPESPQNIDISNESVKLTIRNFEIIKKLAEATVGLADAMILSGSNAWGPFHAVNENSDIDLLVTAESIDALGMIIDRFISIGLLSEQEKQRFSTFSELYNDERVESFSVVFNYPNSKASIDFNFIPLESIDRICKFKQMTSFLYSDEEGTLNFRVIKEFRSVPPKRAGYSMNDLSGDRKVLWHLPYEEIKDEKGVVVGYLVQHLVDSINNTNPNYLIGVWAFFLGISPFVIFDKSKTLTNLIKILQINITKTLKGKQVTYITRQERMSPECLDEIKKSLTL